VKPDDKEQALDGIRKALSIYLQLPTNPIVDLTPQYDADIRVQQLAANIYHLQGQFALSRTVIEAKETTIQALQLINSQQQAGNQIIIQPVNQSGEEDREELLGGIVALKKYQGKGYDINLPLIYRLVRRFLEDKDMESD
jgi:hypothetical protein